MKATSPRHPCSPMAGAGTRKARAPESCGPRVAAVVGALILPAGRLPAMEVYNDQTFENVMLKLDESAFYRCRFVGCQLLYGGGEIVFQECQLERCNFQFYGSAARTVGILPSLGWSYSPPHERLG